MINRRAWIEVSLGAIVRNIGKMKAYSGRKFMACIKADCYGMGAVAVARAVAPVADMFGVATVREALELRSAGIRTPMLVLGMISPEDVADAIRNNVSLTLCDRRILKEIVRAAGTQHKKAKVHIKVDTGMGRIGIPPEQVAALLEDTVGEKPLVVEGIFSHLATAEWKDTTYARGQVGRFKKVLETVCGPDNVCRHIANSPALLNLPESFRDYDMIRIGLLMLGVYPDPRFYDRLPLECAVKGYARLLFVKDVPRGTPLSYGITYRAPRAMKVGTIGMGYADGLRRALSNKFALASGRRPARIVGNVCMDQTLVDLTGTRAAAGDTLQVFGDGFEIEAMAAVAETVAQEILCGFGSRRVDKVYVK